MSHSNEQNIYGRPLKSKINLMNRFVRKRRIETKYDLLFKRPTRKYSADPLYFPCIFIFEITLKYTGQIGLLTKSVLCPLSDLMDFSVVRTSYAIPLLSTTLNPGFPKAEE